MDWTPDHDLWLETDQGRLEARCWGPSPDRSPTLVLLHEGLGSVGLWRDLPARLAAETGWGVLAYSRAGYGRSSPCPLPRPLDYMQREATLVLPQVLEIIGLRKGVTLGHSDGGSIAALHLGEAPDPRIAAAILIAPHFFVEDCSVKAIAAAKDAYENGNLREKLARHHDNVDCAFLGWNRAWLDPAFRDWDISDTLHRIQSPVLAFQGLADPYGTRAQVDLIPGAIRAPARVCLLDECGHAPHQEHRGRVLAEISDFVTGLQLV